MDDKLDKIDLRSEEVQEILTKVPHWTLRSGNTIIICFIILGLIISYLVKYPDIISADALITTEIPLQKEYARISGKFDTIFIKDGVVVEQNKTIAILENTANFNDVLFLKEIIDTISLNKQYFNFPMDSLPLLFLGEIESDFALFENSYIQYKLNEDLQPYLNKSIASRYSINELNQRLRNLESQKELNESELEFKKKDLERNKILFDKGVISALEFDNKQLEYLQAERSYKNMSVSESQIREAISDASSNLKGNNINSTKEKMVLLKTVIQLFNQLKKSIKDWEMKYLFKSNIDGTVSFINIWDKNQTINQGELICTIIPSGNSAFIAKLKAPAQNSGKIRVGQDVNIKLENYPNLEFGVLKGVVSRISLVPDKDGFYYIDVKLPSTLVTTYDKTIEFKQEMRGIAEIITEDLRLIDRFFYQFKKMASR